MARTDGKEERLPACRPATDEFAGGVRGRQKPTRHEDDYRNHAEVTPAHELILSLSA